MKHLILVIFAATLWSCVGSPDDFSQSLPEVCGIFQVYTSPERQCGEDTSAVCFAVQFSRGEEKTGIVDFGKTKFTISGEGSEGVKAASDLRKLKGRLVAVRHTNFGSGGGDDDWYSPYVSIALLPEDPEFRHRCVMQRNWYIGKVHLMRQDEQDKSNDVQTLWIGNDEGRIVDIGPHTILTVTGIDQTITRKNLHLLEGRPVRFRRGGELLGDLSSEFVEIEVQPESAQL